MFKIIVSVSLLPLVLGIGYDDLLSGHISGAMGGYGDAGGYGGSGGGYGGGSDYSSKGEDYYPPQPYKFGYDVKDGYGGSLNQNEEGDSHGNKRGSYGYTDSYGIYRQVDYVADKNGFRAYIKTNEPGTANQNPAYVELHSDAAPAHSDYGHGAASNLYPSPIKALYDDAPIAKTPIYSAPMIKPVPFYSSSAPVKSVAYSAPNNKYPVSGPIYKSASSPSYTMAKAPVIQKAASPVYQMPAFYLPGPKTIQIYKGLPHDVTTAAAASAAAVAPQTPKLYHSAPQLVHSAPQLVHSAPNNYYHPSGTKTTYANNNIKI